MKISIARALKEKSRIIGEMNHIKNNIATKNVVSMMVNTLADGNLPNNLDEMANAKRHCDVNALHDELVAQRKRLIAIKTAITKANAEAAETLVKLSEMKSDLANLETMSKVDNNVEPFTNNQYRITHCVFDSIWIENRRKALSDEVNRLQDAIDEFNATHYIDFDM